MPINRPKIQRPRKIILRDPNTNLPRNPKVKNQTMAVSSSPRKAKKLQNGYMNEVAAAAALGLSVSTLQNRRSLGLPPEFEKWGGRIWYSPKSIQDFIES
ncbi:MAG: hypothetical protein JXQ85_16380 [Cognatishimia sp.]|uniref:hypothetical protein n=1 Tax=Cognatishimia sp. TaxID=2211648 RepID=UPI003B8B7652